MPDLDPLSPIDALASRLRTVDSESIAIEEAAGRFLAEPILADRDSPAGDVSAMDGYAIQQVDGCLGKTLTVMGISRPGEPPSAAPAPGQAVQIFTGAIVPAGCEFVVRREDVEEPSESQGSKIRLKNPLFTPGMNIRRRGENALAGSTVLTAGMLVQAGQIAAAANFGAFRMRVARRIRVQTIVTGDELRPIEEEVRPWQLRDSNGATLAAVMRPHRWIEAAEPVHVADSLEDLVDCVRESMEFYDAILLTGGVSMGDYDFVPAAIQRAGATQVFHKLPVRPGRPILGGVGPEGQLVLGLPGNPVSAAIGAVRFARPLLASMAGAATFLPPPPAVQVANPESKTIPLVWFRLVRMRPDGRAEIVPSKGSGDLVSMALSDGFIEQPADASGAGPWPFWGW